MAIAAQALSVPSSTSAKNAPVTSSLSASVSRNVPDTLVQLRERASQPSRLSVAAAIT